MKLPLLLFVILLNANFCLAQKLDSGGPAQSRFYQEIPFEQINGKIIITVNIAGGKHKFLLDTGAPFTISNEIANQLGITTSKQNNVRDAFGNFSTIKTAIVDNIGLGSCTFKNTTALIGTNVIYQCLGVEGNIGSNLLRSAIVKFDSKNKIIVITDNIEKLDLNNKSSIKLSTDKDKQNTPFFILELGNGVTGDYYIDTGDSGFLSLSNSYMEIFNSHHVCEILSTGFGANSFGQNGAENGNVKKRVLFPKVTLNGATFENVKTETVFNANGSGNNSIGVKILEYGILTLDYIHNKLYFEPFNIDTDLAEKSWPVSPTFSNNKLLVGVVWDELKGKIKPGQQIVAINGVSYENVDFCKLVTKGAILQGREGAILTIKDEQGNLSQLSIVKD